MVINSIVLFSEGSIQIVRQMLDSGMRLVVYRGREVVHTVDDTDACDLDRLIEIGRGAGVRT